VGAIDDADEVVGRVAGSLIGVAGSGAVADALVVAAAVRAGGGVILTGDTDDLRMLAADRPEVLVTPL